MATKEPQDEVSAPPETNEVGAEETEDQIRERAMRQSELGAFVARVARAHIANIPYVYRY